MDRDNEKVPETTMLEHGLTQEKAQLQHEEDAAQGTQAETQLTILQALKAYRKAVLWSFTMSMATVMESYNLILINTLYAFPQFLQKYGEQLPDGTYQMSAKWQVVLTLLTVVGMIPGVFANGILVDKYGYRYTMLFAHVALIGIIFIQFFAPSVGVLAAGCFLLSIPCGIFAAATPGYAAEVCPLALRGYLTTYVNLCWVMGHMIAAGVLIAMSGNQTQWSYRIPFAIQWLWPPFLVFACYLAPESPWWLVRKGDIEGAVKIMDRLVSASPEVVNKRNAVAMMDHTIQTEKEMDIGGSYWDCFKGSNLRRTEIAVISWGCQILPGWAIQNYSTYFFTLAGLSSGNSLKLALGNYAIAFAGTLTSWFIQTKCGRRETYLWGLVAMLPPMLIVGFIDLAPASENIRWAQAALLLVWFFLYGSTIGPVPYAIAAEVGASRLRSKTISLGRNMYYVLSILNTIVAPYMLNPSEGNLKGKAAFPAAALTAVLVVWTFFRLPETKNMTPETLDRLFHARVPARKFLEESKKYQ
ncbi:sugar transporter [Xylariomycetidae sp. FL0641]|nr:sugar transporter [Xylariomycetidae sp. FL0641]